MDVRLLYVDGCPSWQEADRRLAQALERLGHDPGAVVRVPVTTPGDAVRLAFQGSPTVLVDGRDPFAAEDDPVGLSCRLYRTPDGLVGSPTVEQLVEVLGG